MYKNVLQHIENIEIWPMISFVIFFIFFLCLLVWVFKADKNLIDRLKYLPIKDEDQTTCNDTEKINEQ